MSAPRSTRQFTVTRVPDGAVVCVIYYADRAPRILPHLVHHSPTGFEVGYPGSGPADLARSIVGELLNTDNPDPDVYQAVKRRFIVPMWDGGETILEEDLWKVIDEVVAEQEALP